MIAATISKSLIPFAASTIILAATHTTADCQTQPHPGTSCVCKEIAVFGHRSPDTDAISSAIIYAWELRNPTNTTIDPEPICAVPYANSDSPNKETIFVLDYFDIEAPRTIFRLQMKLYLLFSTQIVLMRCLMVHPTSFPSTCIASWIIIN